MCSQFSILKPIRETLKLEQTCAKIPAKIDQQQQQRQWKERKKRKATTAPYKQFDPTLIWFFVQIKLMWKNDFVFNMSGKRSRARLSTEKQQQQHYYNRFGWYEETLTLLPGATKASTQRPITTYIKCKMNTIRKKNEIKPRRIKYNDDQIKQIVCEWNTNKTVIITIIMK